MHPTEREVRHYAEMGYLSSNNVFSSDEIAALRVEIDRHVESASLTGALEKDGKTIRALHGGHLESELFRHLITDPRLLLPAIKVLDGNVYLYQFKVSMKAAFVGGIWPWHQDYVYWYREDGMQNPHVTTAAIFVDDVNDENAPILFLPRSHSEGLIDHQTNREESGTAEKGDWRENVVENIKYTLAEPVVKRLANRTGILSAKGRAGTVVFFHGNIVHASTQNLSPFCRTIILVTYNRVTNAPRSAESSTRPEFLVNRDLEALIPDSSAWPTT